MAIRNVPDFPLRSDGLSQDAYSTGVENSLTALSGAIDDFNSAASAYQLAVTGTSTSSVAIGTGAKSFTTQTGLGFVVGMTLRLAFDSTNYMTGDVTSYNTGTGALVMNITSVVGSGTRATWTISLAATGANTATGVSFTPAGNIAATNVQSAIQELDTEKLSSAAGAVTGTNLEDITTAETVGNSYAIPSITFDVNGRATTKTTAPKIVSGTVINTTSGTSHEFTSIPSGVKKIILMVAGVSTNGTSNLRLRIGPSGGVETSGYFGSSGLTAASSAGTINFTSGFDINDSASAAAVRHGFITLILLDATSNTWVLSGVIGHSNVANTSTIGGSKALASPLSRLLITTVNGTDTFDAGSINILME